MSIFSFNRFAKLVQIHAHKRIYSSMSSNCRGADHNYILCAKKHRKFIKLPSKIVNKTLKQLAFILWFFIAVTNIVICEAKQNKHTHRGIAYQSNKQSTYRLMAFDASIKNNLLYTIYQTDVVCLSNRNIFFSASVLYSVPTVLKQYELFPSCRFCWHFPLPFFPI